MRTPGTIDGAAGEQRKKPGGGATGVGADAFRLQAEGAALEVMGLELHAALRASGGAAEHAKEATALCDTVRGWAKRPTVAEEAPLTSWLRRYVLYPSPISAHAVVSQSSTCACLVSQCVTCFVLSGSTPLRWF